VADGIVDVWCRFELDGMLATAGSGIDFARNEITVRGGKGGKDRVTTLPGSLKKPLAEHDRIGDLLLRSWGNH
jgi:hypothetical protein